MAAVDRRDDSDSAAVWNEAGDESALETAGRDIFQSDVAGRDEYCFFSSARRPWLVRLQEMREWHSTRKDISRLN